MDTRKIFGIGFQRTGTSSLTKALRLLEIDTVHAPMELYKDINHKTIEKYQAFTDNPMPLLYKELDIKFPNSKFILTVRSLRKWIVSVHFLFQIGKIEWADNPVIKKIHHDLYGIDYFEKERFKNVFIEYNNQVINYFSKRPNDLLVMDITKGDGWDKLCPFLELEIPDQAFPHVNKSSTQRFIRTWINKNLPGCYCALSKFKRRFLK